MACPSVLASRRRAITIIRYDHITCTYTYTYTIHHAYDLHTDGIRSESFISHGVLDKQVLDFVFRCGLSIVPSSTLAFLLETHAQCGAGGFTDGIWHDRVWLCFFFFFFRPSERGDLLFLTQSHLVWFWFGFGLPGRL